MMPTDDSSLLLSEMKALRKDLQSFHLDFKEGIQSLSNAILTSCQQQQQNQQTTEISQQDMCS
jgi:hypothetical protein